MRRARWGIGMATWGLLALAAPAQVELTWTLAHGRTVLMEPIRATVRIVNNTGGTLDLTARGNARLIFDVEDQPTSTVPETGRPLVAAPVIIPEGETREVEVNLLDAYRLVKGQSYMLTPAVEFAGLRFSGERRSLEVQPGIELAKRAYGLRAAGDAREVSLRLINRDRNDHLFFRIDDPGTGYCLGVYDLGRVIRFFVPCLEQDAAGDFHVLHQTGPDRFVHSTFSAAGAPLGTTFYSASAGSLRMVRDVGGEVVVTGGTPFMEDPENPGTLVAPALPPAHPYPRALGEAAAPAPAKTKTAAGDAPKRAPAAREKSHAGSEPVSW